MSASGPFAVGGDPNSMLTSACPREGFGFGTGADSHEGAGFDDMVFWSRFGFNGLGGDDDWGSGLGSLPLLSDVQPYPLTSASVSPLSATPSLPDLDVTNDFDTHVRVSDGLELPVGAADGCTEIDADVILDYCKQLVSADPQELEGAQQTQQPEVDFPPALANVQPESPPRGTESQHIQPFGNSVPWEADAQISRRMPTPRRAASETRKRVQAILEQDENDDGEAEVIAQLSPAQSKKRAGAKSAFPSKRRKCRTGISALSTFADERQCQGNKAADEDNYNSDSEYSVSGSNSGGSAQSSRPVKRVRYSDLVDEGHPITLLADQFILDPAACASCTHGLTRSYDLIRHIEAYHQMGDLACEACGTLFSRKDALGRHKQRCRGRPRKRRLRKWEVLAAKTAEAGLLGLGAGAGAESGRGAEKMTYGFRSSAECPQLIY